MHWLTHDLNSVTDSINMSQTEDAGAEQAKLSRIGSPKYRNLKLKKGKEQRRLEESYITVYGSCVRLYGSSLCPCIKCTRKTPVS
jgi:hypothetical protein